MFFCSLSLSDLVSAYGSLRGGGGFAGGAGGGEGGGEVGGEVDRLGSVVLLAEEQIYLLVLVVLLQRVKVDCLAQVVLPAEGPVSLLPLIIPTVLLQVAGLQIILVLVCPVGPHGPYGPGPVGPREPNNIDDNTITNNKIYAPRNLEGPVIVNPQPAPTTTETPSQTDITVAPTTTEEEQQQETTDDDDDDGGESTSAEAQNQIPIANAGPSLTVQPSSNVVLDGTKSSASNGRSFTISVASARRWPNCTSTKKYNCISVIYCTFSIKHYCTYFSTYS